MYSLNHHFSGAMLIFGGVYFQGGAGFLPSTVCSSFGARSHLFGEPTMYTTYWLDTSFGDIKWLYQMSAPKGFQKNACRVHTLRMRLLLYLLEVGELLLFLWADGCICTIILHYADISLHMQGNVCWFFSGSVGSVGPAISWHVLLFWDMYIWFIVVFIMLYT